MIDKYTRAWIRIIKVANFFGFLPWGVYSLFGALIGRYLSFLRLKRERIVENIRCGLGVSRERAESEYRKNCMSSGVAMCMIEKLNSIPKEWLKSNIKVVGEDFVAELCKNGGMIFGLHGFHHNLMMSFFKSVDKEAFAVVNPPTAFSDNDFLYSWTVRLNESTQSNLCGGRMVYVEDKRELYDTMGSIVKQKGIVFVLCDFDSNAKSSKKYEIFGKEVKIPVGALRFASSAGADAYFAGFRWSFDGYYELEICKMSKIGESYEDSYVNHLKSYVSRYPYSWQNWEHL